MLLARCSALLVALAVLALGGCGTTSPRRTGAQDTAAVFGAGQVRGLAHPGFARNRANRGLWIADARSDRDTWGLYLLEAYDPDRIPVLFVHGIGGTPVDFQTMLGVLDRTRFQAWVYYYPTALRLSAASGALYGLLADLEHKHHFGGLAIVAHSMGGLVARGYLARAQRGDGDTPPRLLVTLSSPWQGVASAQAGARLMPGAPESWIDLSPESDFLVSLRAPLSGVPHYVFFGYRRHRNLLSSRSSDGAITVSSQLPRWIQDQAVRYWGYDDDHVGILSDRAVLEQIRALLAFESRRLRADDPAPTR